MTSISLIFRPSIKAGRHPGSLSLRIIHNRRAKTTTLPGIRLYPQEWDKDMQEIIYPENNQRRALQLAQFERAIDAEVDILNDHLFTLEQQGRFQLEDLFALYRRRKNSGKLHGYAESLALGLERRGQMRTAEAYRTVTRGLIQFNKNEDIALPHINSCLIKDFEKHLKESGKMPNTISYYMRNLRAIYNKAVADKCTTRHKENPFSGVYMGVTKTMKRALSVDEVKQMKCLDFSKLFEDKAPESREYRATENLYRAWRYFTFCFYARGMSFVDMVYLRKENIRGGVIRYVRKKTGQQIEIRLTPEMKATIDSFSNEVKGSAYVFPIIRNNDLLAYSQYETALRTQNYRLKKLAILSGIKKQVSTHWARHSWANIGKHENLSIRVISECLGHTSEKTTRIYLDSLDNSLLDAANDTVISAIHSQSA